MLGYEGLHILMAEGRTWKEPGDLEAVQRRILEEARTVLQADICTLFPINPITGDFAEGPQLAGELRGQHDLPFDRPRPTGITRQVLERGELLVEDLDVQRKYKSPFSRGEGLKAFAALALKVPSRPKPLAVLYIDYREPRRFDESYQENLRQFAKEASVSLQNAWLFNRYRRVIEIGQEVNRELDTVESLFQLLERHVSQILDTSYFLMLATYSEQSQTLDLYYKYKGEFTIRKQQEMTPGCRWVIENCKPLVYDEYSTDPRTETLKLADFDPEDPENPESVIFLPLLLRGIPFGVLSIQHLNANAYDNEDLHILEILGNHIASTLNNIRLFDDLTQLSTTGQLLTGPSEGEDVLDRTVRQIQEATRADLVVLYPYHQERDYFDLPPRIRGDFREPDFPQPESCQRPDSPYRVVDLGEPAFLGEADSPAAVQILSSRQGQPSDFQKREEIVSVAALPLRVGGETAGALYLNYRRPQKFNARQRHLIHGLAVFAAIAIKNAWKFGRHGRELAVLNQIDNKLRHTGSFSDLLYTILAEANKIVNADSASILLQNQETEVLKSASHIGLRPRVEGRGITQWVFEHQKPINVANVRTDPKWRDLYFKAIRTTVSELAVPLLDGDKAIGVLNFESPQERAFSEDDLTFVTTLAGQVVLAVKRAQLYEKTRRLANERENLISLTKQVVSQLDLESLLDLILKKAMATTKAAAGVLLLYDEQTQHLVIRSEFGTTQDNRCLRFTLSEGVIGRVAREKAIRYIPDLSVPEWKKIFLPYASEIRSLFAVPLLSGGKLWGVINLESRSLNGFKPEHRHVVAAFAGMAVIALQNAQSHENARQELARFEALLKVGQKLGELNQENERREACKIVTTEVSQSRECRAVIRIYEEPTGDLVLVDSAGKWTETDATWKRMKTTEGLNGWVFQNKTPARYDDTHNIPSRMPRPALWDSLTRSLLIVPIMFGGVYYGNLSLSHRAPYYFSDADQELAQGLARLLAFTFHRLDAIQSYKELQEYSKQAELMGVVGEAAFHLEHRLSNDLGPIRSYVNNVKKSLQSWPVSKPKLDQALEDIIKSTDLVLEMSEKLKQEAGTFQLGDAGDATIQSVLAIMNDLREEFRDRLSPIQLQIDISNDVGFVSAIPEHPNQILSHLVQNSIDAMPEGGNIEIEAKNSGPFIYIRVSDTGPGIPPENREKIFRLLYSSKKSSGFGLWSAKKKAQLNGGSLDLDIQSGGEKGATFILRLPRGDHQVEVQFER